MSVDRPHPLLPPGGMSLSSAEKIGWMASICREALSASTLQQALDRSVHGLVEQAGYFSSSVGLLSEDGDFVINRAWHSRGNESIPVGYRQHLGQGVVARTVRSVRTVIVPDVRLDPDYIALFPEVRSEVCFPLQVEGVVLGVLDVNSDQVDDFDEEGCWLLETLAGLLAQIIEKSRLLQEVRETRDYLEGLIAAAGDAIVTTDVEGKVQRWNAAAESLFGYPESEVLGKPVSMLWHSDSAEEAKRLFRQVVEGGQIQAHEVRRTHRDGRPLNVLLTLSPIHDAQGNVVGLSSIVHDVSEKRRLEARFQEMHERVAASEEKYRSLVQHAQEAIFLVSPEDLVIREANPCAAHLTRRSAERLVGLPWPNLATEEDVGSARRHLRAAVTSGAAPAREIHLQRPDDRRLILEITASAVRAGNDRFLQVIGRDVTERHLAEGEREAMRNRLMQSEKLSVMGELISGVAHELNNPLTGVIGYAQLLRNQRDPNVLERNLERIQHEAKRCHRIVQNLLGFARQRRAEWTAVGVNELLEETLELRAYQMRVENIWVVREMQDDLPDVEGDPHQLQQVFVNLLNNAHQSMAASGRGGVLTVSTRMVRGWVMIRITDNGPGIPEEIRNRIFEPFFTTKGVGEGTGLGLSICHSIVQEHGGKLGVTSRLGAETTFVVEIKAVATQRVDGDEATDRKAGEPKSGAEIEERRRRVLVVDDEETILEFLGEALRCRGHEVDCAANGLHALERMRKGQYDAVITDLKMPGMGGRQLYEALRREQPEMAPRVIFATGDLVARDTLDFLQSTGNTYLEKPFSIRCVAEALRRLDDQKSESSAGT